MSPQEDQDPAPPRIDPLPGRVIAGNFRIDGLIGSGAMGNVYKAEQLSLGKQVAIKVLHPHLMGDEKLVGRFKREAKSASLLNHPNSIQIIDSGQDRDGTLYIAMELLTGRDLAQVIRDDFPLPLPRVVRILSQVLSALEEAHAQRVIHRDLKPSNIMLIQRRDEKDFVKVCDFGIAKATLSDGDDRAAMLTIQGLVCGTPEYMAPEQARAEQLDGRADLYAAAVILYQMVTGDIPFRADSPMAIVSRHLVEAPDAAQQAAAGPAAPQDHRRRRAARAGEGARDALPDGGRLPRGAGGCPRRDQRAGHAGRCPAPGRAADGARHLGARSDRAGRHRDDSGAVAVATIRHHHQPDGTAEGADADPRDGARGAGGGLDRRGDLHRPRPQADAAGRTGQHRGDRSRARHAVALDGASHRRRAAGRFRTGAAGATSGRACSAERRGPPPAAEAPPAAAHETASRDHGKHHHAAVGPAAKPIALATAPAMTVPAAAPVVAPPPAPALAPPARGAVEVLAEADKLLGQGEVADACSHGEEAKRMSPRLPAVYKFLGKCYMRAGRAPQANDNYKKYLELAPNASDAPFVKSMIK